MVFIQDIEMDESVEGGASVESGEACVIEFLVESHSMLNSGDNRSHSFTQIYDESLLDEHTLLEDDAKSVMVEPPSRVHSPSPALSESLVDDFDDNQSSNPLILDEYEPGDIDWQHQTSLQQMVPSGQVVDWEKMLKTPIHSSNHPEEVEMEL